MLNPLQGNDPVNVYLPVNFICKWHGRYIVRQLIKLRIESVPIIFPFFHQHNINRVRYQRGLCTIICISSWRHYSPEITLWIYSDTRYTSSALLEQEDWPLADLWVTFSWVRVKVVVQSNCAKTLESGSATLSFAQAVPKLEVHEELICPFFLLKVAFHGSNFSCRS